MTLNSRLTKPIHTLLLALLLFSLLSGTSHGYDIEDEYAFASQLIATGDYDQAILSLRRYTLFSENTERIIKSRFIVGSLYAQMKTHDRAAACFQELYKDNSVETSLREHAAFLAMQSMFLNEDPASFHVNLDQIEERLGGLSPEGSEQRNYMKGFLGVYAGAGELLELLPVDSENPDIRNHAVALRDLFAFWDTHPEKSPITAGALAAVIPGAGQFYNGRYWDGAVSMGMVLGGAYWSHELFDRGDDHWGWTVGIISGLLYLGQIRNSMVDAVRINERAELEFKQHLVEDYFMKFTFAIEKDSLRFGVRF